MVYGPTGAFISLSINLAERMHKEVGVIDKQSNGRTFSKKKERKKQHEGLRHVRSPFAIDNSIIPLAPAFNMETPTRPPCRTRRPLWSSQYLSFFLVFSLFFFFQKAQSLRRINHTSGTKSASY